VVQGQLYNNGQLQDGIQDIQLPFGQKVSARPTNEMKLAGNLNASAPAFQGDVMDADARQDPLNTSSWTESTISVFDSQGSKRDVKILLSSSPTMRRPPACRPTPGDGGSTRRRARPRRTTAGTPPGGRPLSAPITLPSAPGGFRSIERRAGHSSHGTPQRARVDYDGSAARSVHRRLDDHARDADPVLVLHAATAPAPGVNSGTFTFDPTGIMIPDGIDAALQFAVPAPPGDVELDPWGGDQRAHAVRQREHRGAARPGRLHRRPAAELLDRPLGPDHGLLHHGTTTPLAQIVLADFNNPAGLLRVGDNMYQESANSGARCSASPLEGSQSASLGRARDVERGPGAGVHEHDHRPARLPGEQQGLTTSTRCCRS
jgi:flagellar hook protein FlgE